MTPAAVVGAGPVGLTLAGRLAQQGVRCQVFDDRPRHQAAGSRAICMQRETLEIWQRLGIGQTVADRGAQWRIGRTYFRDRELFSVELPGAGDEHFPPFVNISQSEVEEMLLARLAELGVEVRWGHRLTAIRDGADGVRLTFSTAAGDVEVAAEQVIGTDGAHSGVRHALGMGFPGHSFEDLFLIADVRAGLPFPSERRFYFDPPWNPGRQVLIHPQPDDCWRIDWQVASDTDVEDERRSGRLDRRIRAVIGDAEYELVWLTMYRFHQRIAPAFRRGHAFLAGDAAHLMSPFGARGLNSGVADAENLAWKLASVLRGDAPPELLASYDLERRAAALENLAVTDATMRFMVPRGRVRRTWRNLALRGSVRSAWFRRRVNSGRLAQPFSYADSPLIDRGGSAPGLPELGGVAPDAAVRCPADQTIRRLRELLGGRFVLLLVGGDAMQATRLAESLPAPAQRPPIRVVASGLGEPHPGVTLLDDITRRLERVYAPSGPRAWLIRPDGHLAATRPIDDQLDAAAVGRLLSAATGGAASQ